MTPADLDRLTAQARAALARADAATEGPWRDGPMGDVESDDGIAGILVAHDVCDSDRAFIAAARSDVPALARAVLDLAERERALVAALRGAINCGDCGGTGDLTPDDSSTLTVCACRGRAAATLRTLGCETAPAPTEDPR